MLQIGSLSKLLALDGYGIFVWPAYLITTVVLTGLLAVVLRSLARDQRTLSVLEAERQSRRGASSAINQKVRNT